MRIRFLVSMMLLGVLFIISGCNSANEAYDTAIKDGMTALENEQYADAVTSFEKAGEEKKEEEKAASYLTQAQLLLDTKTAMDNANYDEALTYIEKINEIDGPLDVVKEKADKLDEEIQKTKKEQTYQTEIDNIRSLISEGEYDQAETKLATLQNLLEGDSTFDDQLASLADLIKEGKGKREAAAEAGQDEPAVDTKPQYTYNTYSNARFGFSVKYPSSFSGGVEPTNGDGTTYTDGNCTITVYAGHMNVIEDNETIETYYQRDLEAIGGSASYHTVNGNSYVISYFEGDTIVYRKGIAQDGIISTLIIEYPASLSSQYESIVNDVSESFTGGSQG